METRHLGPETFNSKQQQLETKRCFQSPDKLFKELDKFGVWSGFYLNYANVFVCLHVYTILN